MRGGASTRRRATSGHFRLSFELPFFGAQAAEKSSISCRGDDDEKCCTQS